uniref:Uncharacterized protein n=1 Tax=Lactuca sativa TaxID=4236 RepID=A0A9R1WKG6_LACSA|nr:hypothetical protein LSAT_V11C100004850 [Lactuca sativa]
MDEEGTKYHSRVFNQIFSKFRDLLKEGESYIILKPNMAAVRNGFSVTSQKQTLTLDWKRIVKNVMIFRVQLMVLCLLILTLSLDRNVQETHSLMLLGKLSHFGHLRQPILTHQGIT